MGDTSQTYFMGAGRYDNTHGVGIMLNKKWRQRIIDTEHINERAIATIVVNRQAHSKLQHILHLFIGGDFNAELGLGHGTECFSVGRYTLNEGIKRGDWMKHWLMLQGYTALNTTYRKTPQKQTTFISPKRKEKQIEESGCIVGLVDEAGSIVLYVSNDIGREDT